MRPNSRPHDIDISPSSTRQSLSSETSSTSTAFSPTHSRQSSKTSRSLGLAPNMTALLSDYRGYDLEKGRSATPSPLATAPPTPKIGGFTHIPSPAMPMHLGLRRRRLLGQALMALALVSVLGWWIVGDDVGGTLEISRVSSWRDEIGSDAYTEAQLPGGVIGSSGGGALLSDDAETEAEVDPSQNQGGHDHVPTHGEKMAELAHVEPQQWGLSLSSDDLMAGLRAWPTASPEEEEEGEALSSLGHQADRVYSLGPSSLAEYIEQMTEFAQVFPKDLSAKIVAGLDHFTRPQQQQQLASEGEGTATGTTEADSDWGWDTKKSVWQTDKDTRHAQSEAVASWKDGKARDEGWYWDLLTDRDADKWVKKRLGASRFKEIWDNLPGGILRSDTLRYLLVMIEGGIYTDTDTLLLKSPSAWGQSPRLYKDGEGWLTPAQKARLDAGEGADDVLGRPSVVVGLEADVGDREDWNDWWPRPIQIVQWTLASTPCHPIALNALLRIHHATARAVRWAHDTARSVKVLKDQGRYEEARNLASVGVMDEPSRGGPVGVMNWTGPGVWTDAVLSYLRVKYGVVWTDLRGLRQPLRVGDVIILPVTGFSPGVGNFGAQHPIHHQAMVEHLFAGSWKEQ